MKSLKTFSIKFFAATFVIAMAAGCASVTDAGLAEQPQSEIIEQVTPPTPDPVINGDDIDMIAPEPECCG